MLKDATDMAREMTAACLLGQTADSGQSREGLECIPAVQDSSGPYCTRERRASEDQDVRYRKVGTPRIRRSGSRRSGPSPDRSGVNDEIECWETRTESSWEPNARRASSAQTKSQTKDGDKAPIGPHLLRPTQSPARRLVRTWLSAAVQPVCSMRDHPSMLLLSVIAFLIEWNIFILGRLPPGWVRKTRNPVRT
jgi:hypothetical protein